ncbi:MAG TPA: DUF4396 domain-containing protein [Aurantimonas coralicida]|uniref:DUF4396 domain-containing protein n=2 Tax=root TaxID=1 RepID=A0A9C9NEG9_9HYPH|nr:DUF4396 domain-containing protein [Aurantimonas coralicida]HEU00327.1 DUF4396 domain-containing protein [Aurantimonas coralicida]
MDFGFLAFLADPWFVVPWYVVGAAGAGWALYDMLVVNTAVNPPLKAAWPIIIFFFSIIGLALYWWTCRPAGIGGMNEEEKQQAHHRYVQSMFYKTNGALIHCVGGDGLGIVTAMIVLRLADVTFWQEFWIEYAVGFAFGWFIFQLWAFLMQNNSFLAAVWKAFRAEFFSMLSVMIGMGLVMAQITPRVVGEQPPPDTYAFWGFAGFGLLIGAVLTLPVNYILIRIGWKHGMS